MTEKNLEGIIELLSRNLPGEAEENNEKPQSG
jgi:hypothetical protein